MKRGLLFLIPLMGVSILPVNAPAQGPAGVIQAEPNPCRVRPGESQCETHIIWSTQGVSRVKVFVKSEGRDVWEEREFGHTLSCETNRCRAPWIKPETRYVFKLYDFSRGDRGRELGSVTVTGER
jgi:hypothetical protein